MLVGIRELFSLVSPPSCVRRPLVNDIHYCIAFHAGVMIFDNSTAPPLKEVAVTPGLSIAGSPALLLIKHPIHQLSGMASARYLRGKVRDLTTGHHDPSPWLPPTLPLFLIQRELETAYLVMNMLDMLPPQYRLSRLDPGQQPSHDTAGMVCSQP
ncbi:hypothetical protein FOFC_15543 [Fusarium oxysporum]|nr:hypothetical protein FOFC_15543 [Fusarium oxysporum]